MASAHFCSGGYLLVHPLNELVTVDHHSLTDENGRETFATHQGVCTDAGDAEDDCQLVCSEGDRQLIEGSIGHSFNHIGTPFVGKNVDGSKWILRPSREIIQPPLFQPSEALEIAGFLRSGGVGLTSFSFLAGFFAFSGINHVPNS